MGKRERKAALEAEREREERAARVIERIELAFDGVPVPDANHRTLRQAEAWDGYRRIDQRRDHKGRWQDLPSAQLVECCNALPHLDEQGIQYYLPAIMTCSLHAPPKRRPEIHYRLLYTLEPSTGELKGYQRRRFALLTAAQREAILAFLEHTDAHEEILHAWRRVVAAGDAHDWFRKFY